MTTAARGARAGRGGRSAVASATSPARRAGLGRATAPAGGVGGLRLRPGRPGALAEPPVELGVGGAPPGPPALDADGVPVYPAAERDARLTVAPPAGFSGLNGKALLPIAKYPTRQEVFDAIPPECYEKDTVKSMLYALCSTAITLGVGYLGTLIPMGWAWAPVWAAYWVAAGTAATGMWVVAHECGHGAFSDNKRLQDAVGYALHSVLLVPYFSWQRSHAIHHSKTNHTTEGETHVPYQHADAKGAASFGMKEAIGEAPFAFVNAVFHLVFGWPMYLLTGATGGSKYGTTNHFVPVKPFSDGLFPTKMWKKKVWLSDVGVAAAFAGLLWAGHVWGAGRLACLYWMPYLVTNFWLVLYTWLQHTDVDVPHFGKGDWDWVKGTFMTIDRPYGPVLDFLHHRIGSTHVAHHVAHTIPHYRALKATHALKAAFPDLYLYDPTPLPQALWRVAKNCVAVKPHEDAVHGTKYVFHSARPE